MLPRGNLGFFLPRRIAAPLFPETAPPIEPNAGTLTPALLRRWAKHALRAGTLRGRLGGHGVRNNRSGTTFRWVWLTDGIESILGWYMPSLLRAPVRHAKRLCIGCMGATGRRTTGSFPRSGESSHGVHPPTFPAQSADDVLRRSPLKQEGIRFARQVRFCLWGSS